MDERPIAGRYELHEALGPSSWRATDSELGRDVLLRLGTAAEAGALLSHPNIARVFDQGDTEGGPFVVREYLPGGSLADVGAASLSEDAAQIAARDVAAALAYAHAKGVAHGVLTEANVLFDAEGRAKVADFAGEGEPEDDVRAFGAILQSLATAAPALGPVAAAALAGEVDSTKLVGLLDDVHPVAAVNEPTTVIAAPPPASQEAAPARRRSVVVAVAAAGALLAAGVGTAYLATSGGSDASDPTTESPSGPISAGSTAESTVEEPEAPPPATTGATTNATTTGRTSTAQTTTAPPPATTTEPPPTTTEPPPTTEPPVTTTEPPPTTEPPTETEEPPPTTTEATTTEAG